ncbi:hypothetical protein EVJ58_g3047 [Rhodofomes roseus]|uniref:Cytochrome P450 n=1 Tax=Rhodofomes roseus TaxID=34475 RepID=A0A4Y9YQH2_9APHY|nr:hypothetical protein EVJ58_g3047 [Rhodofomes roseus]
MTGLLLAEGERHRQQRRLMNPAFGPAHVRELTGIFVQKANELARFWQISVARDREMAPIDVLDGLSKATLDVIGLAGFNYDFDSLSLDGQKNELNEAFSVIFGYGSSSASFFKLLRVLFPPLRYLPMPETKEVRKAHSIMRRISTRLVHEKKDAATHKQGEVHQRDLLTLLIEANIDLNLPESQRMSDEDVIARESMPKVHVIEYGSSSNGRGAYVSQVQHSLCFSDTKSRSFLVAGHETTSSATAWALYALSIEPDMQRRLREECLALATDDPTMDELNELPYLEAVVRETLRLHPPLNNTVRETVKDDIIPLSKPYVDVRGKVHDHVKIDKGTMVQIPIMAVNRSKAIWGEDALEFKPERWDKVPETAQRVPGTWANMMTFLGGPRSCIGYRFSLVEMKALIFTLIRAFEFELAVPKEDVTRQNASVQRPILRSAMDKGSQLPMLLKPYQRT